MSENVPKPSDSPTTNTPDPDVDALLAESLKAQSPESFTWKEPERSPRWWQRAEMEQAQRQQEASAAVPPSSSAAAKRDHGSAGVRGSTVAFGLICLMLALWVIGTVIFGIHIEPILVALVVTTLGGLTLVAAGLRPKPGRRL